MLTNSALNSLRNHLKNSIAYARYKVGSTYYQAEIQTAEGNITVTEVQLFDHNGTLWASKAESITRKDAQEGILYRFRFTIIEE